LNGEVVSWERINPQQLQVTVKPIQKPKAKYTADLPPTQTIAFNAPEDNLAASPFFGEMQLRWEQLLAANVRMGTHYSTEGVAEWASGFYQRGESSFEADIGKYDKSQGENVIFGLEMRVYQRLGLSPEFAKRWFDGQETGILRAVAFAFKLVTDIQRRSGQRTTLLGNSIIAVLIVVYFYDVKKENLLWLFFQGDDVKVSTVLPLVPTNAEVRISALTNVSVKPEWFKAGYCCSRFFIEVRNRLFWVYDPMLFAQKLTRPLTEREYQTLDERLLSYQELVEYYNDVRVVEALVPALIERYGVSEWVARALCVGAARVARDLDTFRSVWEKKKTLIGY